MVDLYAHFKDLLEAVIGLDRNVLHVHLGIVLFGLLAWIFPGRARFAKAWSWLLLIEFVNEVFDLVAAVDAGKSPNWPDSIADVINTMLWPTVWCLWWHLRSQRVNKPGAASGQVRPDSSDPLTGQPSLPSGRMEPADGVAVSRTTESVAANFSGGTVRSSQIGISTKESPCPR